MNNEIINYNYCLEVAKLKEQIEVVFLGLGEMLYKIRQGRMYEGNWDSFAEYLQEIKMSESVASRLITVYSKLILEYKIEPSLIASAGGWSNAYELSRQAKDKETAEDLLKEFSLKTPKDVKIKLRELQSGIEQDQCSHENYYILKVCRRCGEKTQVYDTEDKTDKNQAH